MREEKLLGDIGLKIKNYRLLSRLSQEKLAERAGLHRTYIGSLERAEKTPTIITLYKIAQALDIDIINLLPNGKC